MRPIPLGAKGTYTLRVTPAHLANQFKDAVLPQVFATPMMVTIMENAALNAVRDYLDPGESVVGTVASVPLSVPVETTCVSGRPVDGSIKVSTMVVIPLARSKSAMSTPSVSAGSRY